jgi:hypothetical protein
MTTEQAKAIENVRAKILAWIGPEPTIYDDQRVAPDDASPTCADLRLLLSFAADGGWRTMESAPRDGTVVLLWGVDEGCFDDAETAADLIYSAWPAAMNFQGLWFMDGGMLRTLKVATHWRALPLPPAPGEGL